MDPEIQTKRPPNLVEEAIFNAASELEDASARAAFLKQACGGDVQMMARVQELLGANERAQKFFESDPLEVSEEEAHFEKEDSGAPSEKSGERIGRYKLLQKIGEGGMGVVYMAEQQEPIRRRVALKIIKLGMDTASVVARFEAERQALALMDHANIARMIDGGATDSGRPYFVMELVQGVAITEYCDKNRLPLAERIELFLKVCDAIQSAHQKGIIHRDLKPSNVMVTLHDGVPVPKVIDFGVAKATNQELTAKTLFTNYATLIGTPAYMSPEQAEMSGLDIDTRSDVYSLGTILYELLTGTTPFPEQRLRSVGYGEMQKIITLEEPQRLPTRLSTMEGETRSIVSKNRSVEATSLGNELSGDLDSIVMKCLEKDRTRRYESASALAADIRRHQNNEPVLARSQSFTYRAQKFVSRNQLAVAGTAAIVVAILISLIVATISYRGERHARATAEKSQRSETIAREQAEREAIRAEEEALRAARFQYASDMNLARLAVEEGNLFRALQLLERHRPSSTNSTSKIPDLRGWEWRYLWKKCQSEDIATLGIHSNGVNTVGFFPDGRTAFSGGADNTIRFWDIRTMKEKSLLHFELPVMGAAISPNAQWFVSNTDRVLTIREWGTDKPPTIITHKWFRPNTLVFSPDSKLLVYGEYFDGLFLWDLENQKQVAQMPAMHGWMAPVGVDFSPDGNTLAYAENARGEIVFRNVQDHSVTKRWKAHEWYIPRIWFLPDGQHLLSGSSDRTMRIWDAVSSAQLNRIDYPLGFGPSLICSPRLSSDRKFLASATAGGGVAITIQEMPSGKEIRKLVGNKDMVSDLGFSPDGQMLISGSSDGSVRLWDLRDQAEDDDVVKLGSDIADIGPGTFFSTVLSPDGEYLLNIYTNGNYSVRETLTLRETARLPSPVPAPRAIAISPQGKLAAFMPKEGPIIILDRQTGGSTPIAFAETNRNDRLAFSPDGSLLGFGTKKGVHVLDLGSHKVRTLPIEDPYALFVVNFSEDSTILMTAFWSGHVEAWNLTKPNRLVTLEHGAQVNGTALLPGDKSMVSVSREIWFTDLQTGARVRRLQPRPAMFRAVSVSRDGRRLAVGAADGIITVWDLDSMQEVATLSGHTRPLLDLKFLADGHTLVSLDVTELRVWRADSLEASNPGRK